MTPFSRTISLIAELAPDPRTDIQPHSILRGEAGLGFDELDLVDLAGALEREFDLYDVDEAVRDCVYVDDVVRLVEHRTAEVVSEAAE